MKKIAFKNTMWLITVTSITGTLLFSTGYYYTHTAILYSLAITLGTIAYHFTMRLMVGGAIDSIFHNRVPYNIWWFKEYPFEKRLYRLLKVHKWKNHMPTYSPQSFDIDSMTLEDIAMASCQAELVHETILLLSFVPLLFSIPFGDFYVFLFTSIGAALFDFTFILMQRYNRPRLLRLIEYKKTKQSA